jgi:Lar family restriction alleviation protein
MDKLKPCPFCGGEAKVKLINGDDGSPCCQIVCAQCLSKSSRLGSLDQAFIAWNRRK